VFQIFVFQADQSWIYGTRKENVRVSDDKTLNLNTPARHQFQRKEVDMSTILVVEDESNVRKLVVVNLVQRGYKVLQAENGQAALDCLNSDVPKLIILDIKLPDFSGWRILDYLATKPAFSNVPVLVMTATPLDPQMVLNQYPRIIDILVKPFNTARMITLVQKTLAKN
jgi:two-component system, OmpR family, alkaline phosphatase synthesis response regulator PhoP